MKISYIQIGESNIYNIMGIKFLYFHICEGETSREQGILKTLYLNSVHRTVRILIR